MTDADGEVSHRSCNVTHENYCVKSYWFLPLRVSAGRVSSIFRCVLAQEDQARLSLRCVSAQELRCGVSPYLGNTSNSSAAFSLIWKTHEGFAAQE